MPRRGPPPPRERAEESRQRHRALIFSRALIAIVTHVRHSCVETHFCVSKFFFSLSSRKESPHRGQIACGSERTRCMRRLYALQEVASASFASTAASIVTCDPSSRDKGNSRSRILTDTRFGKRHRVRVAKSRQRKGFPSNTLDPTLEPRDSSPPTLANPTRESENREHRRTLLVASSLRSSPRLSKADVSRTSRKVV